MKIIVLPLVLAACLVGQSTERSTRESFIVRVSEGRSTLHSVLGTSNYNNCLIIMPDGRMKLQLRSKEFFDGTDALTTYQSALPNKDLEVLRGVTDDEAVKALPPFGGPLVVPKDVDEWQVLNAEIARSERVQHVGYVTWQPEPDNAAWNRAKLTLRRLVEWSHAVQDGRSMDWKRVVNSSSFCGQ
jgi:hypothetical protein